MKRALSLVLLFLFLTSCGKNELTCYQLFDALSLGEIHAEVYPYSSDLANGRFFSRLYLGSEAETKPNAFSYCDDYYVALSSGTELWELHIFHLISTYHLAAVETMLATRRDRLQKDVNLTFYSDTTYERIKQAAIFSVGHYVVLAITDNNEQIHNEVIDMIQ